MKKCLLSILLVSLSFALASCGSSSGSAATEAPETVSTTSSEAELESGNKTVRNIVYCVPIEWKETTNDEGTVYYYPTGNSMDAQLMVMTPDVDPGTTITDEAFFHSCVDGMVNSSEKSTESTRSMETNANGLPYGYVEFSAYINNAPFNVYTALFDCTDGIVGFVFTQSPDLTPGYLDDYRTVIDSIKPEEMPVAEESPVEEPAQEEPQSSEPSALSVEECESILRSILTSSFGEDNYSLSRDENVITINMWGNGVSADATLAMYGNQDCINSWNNMMDQMVSVEKSLLQTLADAGHNELMLILNVVNDANKDNILACVSAGTVIYDAVNNINLLGIGE